jgi:hypothetical protein
LWARLWTVTLTVYHTFFGLLAKERGNGKSTEISDWIKYINLEDKIQHQTQRMTSNNPPIF